MVAIEEVVEESDVVSSPSGKPAGGLGNLIDDAAPPRYPGDGVAGAVEGLHTCSRALWGRRGGAFEAVFEGVKEDVK